MLSVTTPSETIEFPKSTFLGFMRKSERPVPATPNNSPETIKERSSEENTVTSTASSDSPSIRRQSSSGIDSQWDVKIDPRAMTVDCSCGFSMFRRFTNKN